MQKLIIPGTNDWNVELIRNTLPQYEEKIRNLVPSSTQLGDERAWLFNATGEYTTKSGYATAKLNNGDPETQDLNWKKCIWKVETSPKIRHFMWKACNKALPVGSALETRNISVDPTCKRCGAIETELHVLLLCPFAVKVWDLVPCMFKPVADGINSMASLLTQCRKMISLPPVGVGTTPIYPWILWILWINRNKLRFENKVFSEESTVLKAVQDARAWKAAQTSVLMPSLPHVVVPSSRLHVVDSITVCSFSDAAWDSTTGNCGLGWLLRDAGNLETEGFSSHRRYVPSALVAEALAVKAAVATAVSSHVSRLTVNSDSKNLVLLLRNQGQDMALRGLLHDIRVLARSLHSISFVYVPRLANIQADSLAKATLTSFSFPASTVV